MRLPSPTAEEALRGPRQANRPRRCPPSLPCRPGAAAEPDGDTADARDAAAAVPVTGGGPLGLFSGVRLPDFRSDLLAMPEVVRTTRILWAAFALGLFAIVAGLVFPLNDPGLSGLVLPLFIQAPGIPVLVGGFVAPRGAWLIGGVWVSCRPSACWRRSTARRRGDRCLARSPSPWSPGWSSAWSSGGSPPGIAAGCAR